MEQNNGGTYTELIYSPTGFKMQVVSGTSNVAEYAPMPGGGASVWTPSGFYYRHGDWLGSSRFASTKSRTVYYDAAYAPFGQPYAETGTTDRNFTGMDQGIVSGLYDFPAREYNSLESRWPSPDPAGIASVNPADPQTWNRYAYVRDSPLMMVDPTGMDGGPATIISPPSIGCQQLPLYCEMAPSAPDNGLISIPQSPNPAWCNPIILIGCGWPAGAGPSGPPPYACQYALANPCGGGSPTVTGKQPQTPNKKPASPPQKQQGNSWSHPFTPPTCHQWGLWAAQDLAIAFLTSGGGKSWNPFSVVFGASGTFEALVYANYCQ